MVPALLPATKGRLVGFCGKIVNSPSAVCYLLNKIYYYSIITGLFTTAVCMHAIWCSQHTPDNEKVSFITNFVFTEGRSANMYHSRVVWLEFPSQ